MGSKAKITTVSIVRENEVIPMNKAIPPCKNTAAKIAIDFHLSDAKVAAAMYSSTAIVPQVRNVIKAGSLKSEQRGFA